MRVFTYYREMTASDRATILIADDEQGVADAYAAQLSPEYDVETAYSGDDALAALTPDVDVVLLDRRMPDVGGDDVLAEIRDRGLDIRVAMVTAVDPDFDIIEMPFDDYVVKPVTRQDLIDTIERLLTCVDYESRIREYYALSSKHAALQASKTSAELRVNEEFQELEEQLGRLQSELDRIVTSFDDEDYEVLLRDFGGSEAIASDAE